MITLNLKQHYVAIGILCDYASPTVSKCDTTDVMCNHVCNAVILTSHWSYIVEKQVIGGRLAETDTTPPIKRHCIVKMIFKPLHYCKKGWIMLL